MFFFGYPVIKTGSQNQRFLKNFYKQGLKITHFDEKMSEIWSENHKQGINFSRFSQFFCHKQGQGFKVRAAPPYPNLGRVPPPPPPGFSSTIYSMVGIETLRLLVIFWGNLPSVICAQREISERIARKCNMISQKVKKLTRLSEL